MKTNALVTPGRIEPLEARIAPAGVLEYSDIDGDLVRITTSLGDVNDLAGAIALSPFGALGQQLLRLNFAPYAVFDGTNVSVIATRQDADLDGDLDGDGFANVGYINATGLDLGTVTIDGDLGAIDAGDPTTDATSPAIKLLSVRSMGRFGLVTQGGAGDLASDINGMLVTLKIAGDFKDAKLKASPGLDGRIGSITIGGSVIGGDADNSGEIYATGEIGPVKVGEDLHGGAGAFAGRISTDTHIVSATIGGSVIGSAGQSSGRLSSFVGMGPVKIGRDVAGGDGQDSGIVICNGDFPSLTIGGSVLGGVGANSGVIRGGVTGAIEIGGSVIARGPGSAVIETISLDSITLGGSLVGGAVSGGANTAGTIESFIGGMGAVKIGGSIIGGSTGGSGAIHSEGDIASLTIGGSVIGGTFTGDGSVFAEHDIGPVKIGGSVTGDAPATARIQANTGKIGAITIGGSLSGGDGDFSGNITSAQGMGAIKVGGDVRGGEGQDSGQLNAGGGFIGNVTLVGSLIGGAGLRSGSISGASGLGAVKIGLDVAGGEGASSGRIGTGGKIASVTIGGSLAGGAGLNSGQVLSGGDMGAVKIARDLRGGSIDFTDPTLGGSGYIQGDRIASVFIGGSIIAGTDDSTHGDLAQNASIRAHDDIGAITVKGSLIGNATVNGIALVHITARGQETLAPGAKSDLAIKSLKVGGRVELARISAGFDVFLGPVNNNASIGAISVGRDWIAASVTAGIADTNADGFGNIDDAVIATPAADALIARIASISIKGIVLGTAAGSDHFGFTAQQIGSFKSLNFTAPLTTATNAPIELAATTADVTIREI